MVAFYVNHFKLLFSYEYKLYMLASLFIQTFNENEKSQFEGIKFLICLLYLPCSCNTFLIEKSISHSMCHAKYWLTEAFAFGRSQIEAAKSEFDDLFCCSLIFGIDWIFNISRRILWANASGDPYRSHATVHFVFSMFLESTQKFGINVVYF